MCYKHILVAVDLSDESHILIRKATSLAKLYKADVSIVHVDINYSDLYTGLIDLTIRDIENKITTETHNLLANFAEQADYPIKRTLSGNGDLGQVLLDAITKYNVDLVVCGHHQDFWSKLMSSARQVINTLNIDTLVVPLTNKKSEENHN